MSQSGTAMSELLVYLTGDDACDWSLRTTDGSAQDGDATHFAQLPGADRVVAIVPAASMRTLAVALPPTPPDKRDAVVRFALEDQLAGDVDQQHIVVAAAREREVVVHVVERPWLAGVVAALTRAQRAPDAIVAESDLVAHARGSRTWVWREDGGFLIDANGRVSVLDRGTDALPSGLLLALRNAPASRVVVRGPDAIGASVDAWTRATGVRFEHAAEWTWRDAQSAAIERAPDLLTPELFASTPMRPRVRRPGWAKRAAVWAVAALLLHTVATISEWAGLRWRTAQIERETNALIVAAAPDLAGDVDAQWRRRFASLRHAQGRIAPDDALPLIADAASALTDVPAGGIRVIQYEAGQLTLDIAKPAAAALSAAAPGWEARGLSVLRADTANGIRIRLTRR